MRESLRKVDRFVKKKKEVDCVFTVEKWWLCCVRVWYVWEGVQCEECLYSSDD
jgi:hypothetical protein